MSDEKNASAGIKDGFAVEDFVRDTGIGPLTHAMIWMIAGGLLAFLAWAAVTPVDEIAKGTGEFVPAGAVRALDHLEGGIVEEVLVKEGEVVAQGQPLLSLTSTATISNRDQLIARRTTLQLQAERFAAFAERRRADFHRFTNDEKLIAEQERLLNAQIGVRVSQEKIFQEQVTGLEAQIDAVSLQKETLAEALALIDRQAAIREGLVGKGLNPLLQLLEIQRERTMAVAQLRELDSSIWSLRNDISQVHTRISEFHGRLLEEALNQLETANAELAEIREQLTAQNDRIKRLLIVAPAPGIVQELAVRTVGGVLKPGETAARLVPLDDELIAEVQISPRDIGFVQVGQAVKLKVMAFDFSRYGHVYGKISSISPSTFLDANKVPYYLCRIHLDSSQIGSEGETRHFLPGMTIHADILTGKKTILQYFLKPLYTIVDGTLGER
ncbi:HlyD family type I secretion periplasmic adaptor subunit [Rhodovulum sulfidophilum]|uniref:HlyD family type I secretion periplasmic adaptor subunit n=1 Tax=Rhodovulum sulfidophilum TaxID=35806 RepID=UPI0009516C51|nr:HlyD family type I secretion periplasmic adaptor subunit [Rhodovulum sulfidophilum]MBL3554331.1 HlyD family type I secretion periplasmic adaptor subunit [Rhodovulum sulfidophilum]OLS47717.1 hypothetical protein BV379_05065 [Rhodovulum sulfidophilum]